MSSTNESQDVEARYAGAARRALAGQDTGLATGEGAFIGAIHYAPADTVSLPAQAVSASLGCGNPVDVAELHEGETVLDLGSGGGLDVLLSARRVGPTGRAIGLDMTDDMLTLARRHATEAGVTNAEFHKGHIEAIPLPDDSVDVVISNCVIALSSDKSAVFTEIARVLRPGSRLAISDIIAADTLTDAERADRADVECLSTALTTGQYRELLDAAGFTDITVEIGRQAGHKLHAAIVRAVASTSDSPEPPAPAQERYDATQPDARTESI